MNHKNMKTLVWGPTVLCALVSLAYLFDTAAKAAFLSLLPICFMLIAFYQKSLLGRIEELEIDNKKSSDR